MKVTINFDFLNVHNKYTEFFAAAKFTVCKPTVYNSILYFAKTNEEYQIKH